MEAQNEGNFPMTLRPRRSALSDISNKIVSQFNDITRKGSKKRKLSNSSTSSTSPSEATSNPINKTRNSKNGKTATNENKDPIETNKTKKVRLLPLRQKDRDPIQCLHLIDDLYSNFKTLEEKFAPTPYMATAQNDVNYRMRSILVDWLVEVHHKFKLQPATLWLCVNMLDRYLSKVTILRNKLQLVGVASLFIACKFEEIYPPEVKDCSYITDHAYSQSEILEMETKILDALDFQVCVPTGYHFLTRYLTHIRASDRTKLVASYYAERNLQEPDMLRFSPSVFTAAAIYAALVQQNQQYDDDLCGVSAWPRLLQEETGLEEKDLIECAKCIVQHVSEEPQTNSKRRLIAAKKKYSTEKYQSIAVLDLPVIEE